MTVRTRRSDRWVRAFVGDVAVVDSREPLLFYEQNFPVPGYAFAKQDVRTDLLRPALGAPPREPFFFLPKGPVVDWFDLEVGGRTIRHAAWARDAPELADRLILSWQPGVLDRWLEEEEEVASHPRDPSKRVDALPSSRHVVVSLDGLLLGDTTRPVLLFETDLPTRFYFPRADVNVDALRHSANRSHCPYKGVADQYWDVDSHPDAANAAWSYSEPFPAVGAIAGMIAFYNELVDVAIDGVTQDRPLSVFTAKANRPGSEPPGDAA
ncbi:MAG: DUF427 domain-containing protein [Geodermatophilaceae bacterium]|nr:DUF427 domain-containing protein [Geodermatophilaceae bacterium]